MHTSPEFVALCQSQIALLTQSFGAAWCAVYLTEELGANVPKLIPIAVYPDASSVWLAQERDTSLRIEVNRFPYPPSHRLLAAALPDAQNVSSADPLPPEAREEQPFKPGYQVALPLLYQERVMGVLAVGRRERKWTQQEVSQLEEVARTLAIAELLERRQVWYQQQLREQLRLHQSQGDRFDDLLHQIRNPMTALRTFAKLLLKRLLPEDRNRQVAQSLVRESDRLQELLKQLDEYADSLQGEPISLPASTPPPLLPAAREEEDFDSGAATAPLSLFAGNVPSLEAASVAEILTPLLVSAEAIAQERNLDLRAEIPADLPAVRADTKALREVLSNLIDNALKYTPAGGIVEVRAGIERPVSPDNWQGIAIRDSGPGIPLEDRTHIFERRYRGIQAEGEIAGTGLGLAIAKELVEQMQGEIELVDSLNTLDVGDWGATFVVWLPTATCRLASTRRDSSPHAGREENPLAKNQ